MSTQLFSVESTPFGAQKGCRHVFQASLFSPGTLNFLCVCINIVVFCRAVCLFSLARYMVEQRGFEPQDAIRGAFSFETFRRSRIDCCCVFLCVSLAFFVFSLASFFCVRRSFQRGPRPQHRTSQLFGRSPSEEGHQRTHCTDARVHVTKHQRLCLWQAVLSCLFTSTM